MLNMAKRNESWLGTLDCSDYASRILGKSTGSESFGTLILWSSLAKSSPQETIYFNNQVQDSTTEANCSIVAFLYSLHAILS